MAAKRRARQRHQWRMAAKSGAWRKAAAYNGKQQHLAAWQHGRRNGESGSKAGSGMANGEMAWRRHHNGVSMAAMISIIA